MGEIDKRKKKKTKPPKTKEPITFCKQPANEMFLFLTSSITRVKAESHPLPCKCSINFNDKEGIVIILDIPTV